MKNESEKQRSDDLERNRSAMAMELIKRVLKADLTNEQKLHVIDIVVEEHANPTWIRFTSFPIEDQSIPEELQVFKDMGLISNYRIDQLTSQDGTTSLLQYSVSINFQELCDAGTAR